MNFDRWKIAWFIILLLLSIIFYVIHYAIFRDAHHIFLYLIGDIAFVFIEVLLVTLIIHQLLSDREKKARLNKLNMIIGAFFSEVGTKLLKDLSDFDISADNIKEKLAECKKWPEKDFINAGKRFSQYEYKIDYKGKSLTGLRSLLADKKIVLLSLLQNSNLLEHESFSDLLWSVFHLAEELEAREDIENLSSADCNHIAYDIKRAYVLLISEWLNYMNHLRTDYPYLFSLAIRMNPFDPDAVPEIKE